MPGKLQLLRRPMRRACAAPEAAAAHPLPPHLPPSAPPAPLLLCCRVWHGLLRWHQGAVPAVRPAQVRRLQLHLGECRLATGLPAGTASPSAKACMLSIPHPHRPFTARWHSPQAGGSHEPCRRPPRAPPARSAAPRPPAWRCARRERRWWLRTATATARSAPVGWTSSCVSGAPAPTPTTHPAAKRPPGTAQVRRSGVHQLPRLGPALATMPPALCAAARPAGEGAGSGSAAAPPRPSTAPACRPPNRPPMALPPPAAAPSCEGNCPQFYRTLAVSNKGDGASCWTGSKSRCQKCEARQQPICRDVLLQTGAPLREDATTAACMGARAWCRGQCSIAPHAEPGHPALPLCPRPPGRLRHQAGGHDVAGRPCPARQNLHGRNVLRRLPGPQARRLHPVRRAARCAVAPLRGEGGPAAPRCGAAACLGAASHTQACVCFCLPAPQLPCASAPRLRAVHNGVPRGCHPCRRLYRCHRQASWMLAAAGRWPLGASASYCLHLPAVL